MERLLQNLRFSLRMLRRNPGLTATVLLTLALGIGANTAIFTVDYATLLAPLPYPHPDQLLGIPTGIVVADGLLRMGCQHRTECVGFRDAVRTTGFAETQVCPEVARQFRAGPDAAAGKRGRWG